MTDTLVASREEDSWWGLSKPQAGAFCGLVMAGVVLFTRHQRTVALLFLMAAFVVVIRIGELNLVRSVGHYVVLIGRPRCFVAGTGREAGEVVAHRSRGRVALREWVIRGRGDLVDEPTFDLGALVDDAMRQSHGAHISVHAPWGETHRRLFVGTSGPTSSGDLHYLAPLRLRLWREYCTHLRHADGVVTVLRVQRSTRDQWALHRVAASDPNIVVSVHAHVFSESRGRRRAERSTHRTMVDAMVLGASGFRNGARRTLIRDTVRKREIAVSQGRALTQWGVYIVVSANNLQELRERREMVEERARQLGLHLTRGWARQRQFWLWQLPGGMAW